MPKYKCKDCGAVSYGWGRGQGLPQMRGQIGTSPYKSATKK